MPIATPLDIGWDHAWWAEGPEFAALGLGDGAAVATWPDEVGSLDLAQATPSARPALDLDGLNARRPAIAFDGGDDRLTAVPVSAWSQPITRVVVAQFLSLGATTANDSDLVTNATGTGTSRALIRAQGDVGVGRWIIYSGTERLSAATVDLDPHLLEGFFDGGSSYLNLDGSTIISGASPGTAGASSIGVGGVAYSHVQIAFVGQVGRALTGGESADLTDWFDRHYISGAWTWTPGRIPLVLVPGATTLDLGVNDLGHPAPIDLALDLGAADLLLRLRANPAPLDLALDVGIAALTRTVYAPAPIDFPITVGGAAFNLLLSITAEPLDLTLEIGQMAAGFATRAGSYPNPDDAPGWTGRLVDMRGQTITNLPHVLAAVITDELNTDAQAAFAVPKYDPTTLLLRPLRTEVQLYRNEDLMFWGPVISRDTGSSDGVMTAQARDPWWYIKRRYFGSVGRTNLLKNGGFEDGTGRWSRVGCTLASVTDPRLEGERSGRLDCGAAGQDAYIRQTFVPPALNGEPRNIVHFSAWVWIDAAEWIGPAFDARGLWYSISGPKGTRSANIELDAGTDRDQWVELRGAITYYPGDGPIEVRLYAPGGRVYWDAVQAVRNENTSSGFSPGSDQAELAKRVVGYAQNGRGKSPVNIGYNTPDTGVFRVRAWPHAQHDPIEDALAELVANEDGIDWSLDLTPTTRTFRTHYPRMGVDRRTGPDAVTLRLGAPSDGGNLSKYGYGEDGASTSTSVISLGDGDGPTRHEGGAMDTASLEGLVLEHVVDAPDGMAPFELDPYSREQLSIVDDTVETLTLTTHVGDVDEEGRARLIHGLKKGDLLNVVIDDGPVQIDGSYRLTKKVLTSRPETLALTVTAWAD